MAAAAAHPSNRRNDVGQAGKPTGHLFIESKIYNEQGK